jgi:hypothetical protein
MRKLRDAGMLKPEQLTCFAKPLPKEELYDLLTDPHELKNLATEAEFAAELKGLRTALDDWKVETADVTPAERTPDEFDREAGTPLPNRQGNRRPK